jgi:hypothetical protein
MTGPNVRPHWVLAFWLTMAALGVIAWLGRGA